MKFEFGKYTEVTKLAHSINPEYTNNNYSRIFICWDTNVFWLARILPGVNMEYENDSHSFLLERERIDKDRTDNLGYKSVKNILQNDSFENWDCVDATSESELIDIIDGGYGII